MYPTYAIRTAPCAGRQAARRAPSYVRNLSNGPGFFPPALFGARHHPFFGPPAHRGGRPSDVFDHFDDFVNRSFDGLLPGANADRRTRGAEGFVWQPRFDVREVEEAYQLRGELPGVEAKDLEVEFTNDNTLVIRGRTQTERTEGQPTVEAAQQQSVTDTAESSAQAQAEADKDDTASVHSESSYVKPTVEDEADQTRRESIGTETTADAPGAATPQTDSTVAQQAQEQFQQPQTPQPKYWVSERLTGSFARSFEFPGRVDADGVSASLKNGILDVNVPKAKAPEARKINVL